MHNAKPNPFARLHPDPWSVALPPLLLDRQRIVHSAAFRRLQYKTQVFVALESDHFRTRLTHTLEVAHLARLIALRITANSAAGAAPPRAAAADSAQSPPDSAAADPDLAEIVALAHDLGHPPFGHAGERALAACMHGHGGFEHNAHSLRVVEYLEHPYPTFRGLNLTRVVRECLAKHSTRFDAPAWHALQDGRPAPLEGQIADLADRLAYGLHDLQDGLHAGLIDRAALHALEIWRDAYDGPPPGAAAEWRGHVRPTIDRIQAALLDDVAARSTLTSKAFAASETTRVDGDPAGANAAPTSAPSSAPLSAPTSAPTPAPTPAPTSAPSSAPISAPTPALVLSGALESRFHAMETLLLESVYRHHRLRRMDSKARRIVTQVFEAYVAEPDLMPKRYADRIGEQGLHRVVADYVAGMTDRFCIREHRRLFDPDMEV